MHDDGQAGQEEEGRGRRQPLQQPAKKEELLWLDPPGLGWKER